MTKKWKKTTNEMMVTTLKHVVVISKSIGETLTPNEITIHHNAVAMEKAHEKVSYRLKKWFLSLRWVNNYLWRRANSLNTGEMRGRQECWHSWETQKVGEPEAVFSRIPPHNLFSWVSKVVTFRKPYTMIFPDYSSIRELPTKETI
jgi:hypothetical protein